LSDRQLRMGIAGAAAVVGAALMAPAQAADQSPDKVADEGWWSGVKLHGHVDAGITFNPDDPNNRQNFGQLFTDKANQLLLNQLLLTVERPLDANATGYDFGFKLQGMYGTDARYTHFLGEFDRSIHDRAQADIVEANVLVHTPWLTSGGIDFKIGQYPSPLGAEVIDAEGNWLYSHSYIFNFGVPFKHTGALTTTHLNSTVDLYFGLDTGVNTSLGNGDNNDRIAGIAGFGLNNLADGKLSVVALTHIGPENPTRTVPFANSALRYLNDVVLTYKATDKLTLMTDANYIRDDGFGAIGWGLAQYGKYDFSDTLSLAGRAELWRDNNGFFVAAFPNNLDAVNAQRGFPNTSFSGGRTTYGALTVGLNIKPNVSAVPLATGLTIRPELRYDRSLNDTRPFSDQSSKDQFTAAVDFVLAF
jgi:hypothetical protein